MSLSTRAWLEEGQWHHELDHRSSFVLPSQVRHHKVMLICDNRPDAELSQLEVEVLQGVVVTNEGL